MYHYIIVSRYGSSSDWTVLDAFSHAADGRSFFTREVSEADDQLFAKYLRLCEPHGGADVTDLRRVYAPAEQGDILPASALMPLDEWRHEGAR